jgi:hypothetical protein
MVLEGDCQQLMLHINLQIILNAWNNNRYIAGVFCHLKKAFDCVNHKLLLKKLQFMVLKAYSHIGLSHTCTTANKEWN